MTEATPSRTWFITGASRGQGARWAEAILARGDRLAATARDKAALAPLSERHGDRFLPLQLDVRDSAAVRDAVRSAEVTFGGIDVLVNNAGHMLIGAARGPEPYAGAGASGFAPGDPAATAEALLALAETPEPPMRVLFGTGGLEALRTEYAGRLAGLEQWDHLARLAQGNRSGS